GIRLHGEREVLVHAAAVPPDLAALRVAARERPHVLDAADQVLPLAHGAEVDVVQLPAVHAVLVAADLPAAEVVAAPDHPGAHAPRYPRPPHLLTDAP